MLPTIRRTRSLGLSALLACLTPLLGGCGAGNDQASTGAAPSSALGNVVKRATDEAREQLATQNISLSREIRGNRADLPKAEITPQGDLLIAGESIRIDHAQRALLLEHRAHLVAIAETGIAIGVQGADLGMKAASMAIKGVLSGNMEQLERDIEAEAAKIEIEALKICDLLPALMQSQRALANAVPETAPYATMEQADIDDCRKDKAGDEGSVAV